MVPQENGPNVSATQQIVLCADENFAIPLTVTLRSLMESLTDVRSVRVSVLSLGITEATSTRIEESVPDLALEFLPIEDVIDPRLRATGHLSLAAYGRLFAPSVLGSRSRYLLYLDADLLILDDVLKLFNHPLGGAPVAAIQDQAAPVVSVPGGLTFWRDLGLSPHTPCLNSGVLLIDTEIWNEMSVEQKVIDLCDRYAQQIRWADQDGLNAVLGGNFSRLACRWNQQSVLRNGEHLGYAFFDESEVELAVGQPAIVHFTAGAFKKPWKLGSPQDPAAAKWFEMLGRTSFVGFEPPTPSFRQRLHYAKRVVSRRFK